MACPGRWWSRHPWQCSRGIWMRSYEIWFSSNGNGRTVGLDDLVGPFQPCDSQVTIWPWKGRKQQRKLVDYKISKSFFKEFERACGCHLTKTQGLWLHRGRCGFIQVRSPWSDGECCRKHHCCQLLGTCPRHNGEEGRCSMLQQPPQKSIQLHALAQVSFTGLWTYVSLCMEGTEDAFHTIYLKPSNKHLYPAGVEGAVRSTDAPGTDSIDRRRGAVIQWRRRLGHCKGTASSICFRVCTHWDGHSSSEERLQVPTLLCPVVKATVPHILLFFMRRQDQAAVI